MIKYRRLTVNELELLEADFVRFLASNSIQAQDWQKLKSDSPDMVDELLDIFSNTVLEKVYSKAHYLIIVKPTELHAFKMGETTAKLLGVHFKNIKVNLLDEHVLKTVFSSEQLFLSHKPELFGHQKKYDKPKAEEVFFLVKQGAELVDNKWFMFLEALNTTR